MAVEWLLERYANDHEWDLSGVTLVLPGARAQRRLLELLTGATGERVLIPPTMLTPGSLPEVLYTSEARVVEGSARLAAWLEVLRRFDTQGLQGLTSRLPERDDTQGWLALSEELDKLRQTLAAEGWSMREAGVRLAELPDFVDAPRWDVLSSLEEAYEKLLALHGLTDRDGARRSAIEEGVCRTECDIVLVGAIDFGQTLAEMLGQVAGRVTVLVHAPESSRDGFDVWGRPIVARWAARHLPIKPEQVRTVDAWHDQAVDVLRVIASTGDPLLQPDGGITVGMGDDALSEPIERAMSLAGVPARPAQGRMVARSRPAHLLDAWARWSASHRIDEFATLLRHPDIEAYLDRINAGGARAEWITLLDRYMRDHFTGTLTDGWLGQDETQENLKHAHDAIALLLPGTSRRKPLHEWAGPLAAMLKTLYGHLELRHYEADDHAMIEPLRAIGDALGDLASLRGCPFSPVGSAADAALWVLRALASQRIAPPPTEGDAVEIVGFLELALDDAPAIIVTGFNEGLIPESVTGDAFLPEPARRTLGLTDNARRYVRDLVRLTSILQSHEHVTLIAARRDTEGYPLSPSRLLMARDDKELPGVIGAFFKSHAEPVPQLTQPGGVSDFLIPLPDTQAFKPIDSLRVTAFRDYLACPYRFYLKHVLKLRGVDESPRELDAARFGTLVHDTLEDFGSSDLADCDDAQRMAGYLRDALDKLVAKGFGSHPPVAVVMQKAQALERLEAFAHVQSAMRREGWRILPRKVESEANATIELDGKPFGLTGRIDRIDMHPERGYRIIDFKTADNPKTPEGQHRRRVGDGKEWVDLQLPLYRVLAQTMGVNGGVELGYFNLPRKVKGTRFVPAEWDAGDLDGAMAVRDGVIRKLRAGHFWPPGEPTDYPDGLESICADGVFDRAGIIEQSLERGGRV